MQFACGNIRILSFLLYITINFNDPEWILDHITIALQRASEDEVVKKPCDLDSLEQYLILADEQDDSFYSVKVVPVLLSNVGITEEQA